MTFVKFIDTYYKELAEEIAEFLEKNSEALLHKIVENSSYIAEACICLRDTSLFTTNNFKKLCAHAEYANGIASVLLHLVPAHINHVITVTQDDFDTLCIHAKDALSIAKIIKRLNKIDSLWTANQSRLLPRHVYDTILSNSKYAREIALAVSPKEDRNIREILDKANLFTINNFKTLCTHAEHIDSFTKVFNSLFYSELTQDDFSTLCSHAKYASSIAKAIEPLANEDYITRDIYNIILSNPKYAQEIVLAMSRKHVPNNSREVPDNNIAHNIRMAWQILEDNHIPTQDNFLTICRYAQHASRIVTDFSVVNPLTQDAFNTIISKIKQESDVCRIRRAARIIAQSYRDSSSIFSKLPAELGVEIAGLCGDGIFDEKTAEHIASENFGRPMNTA
ncbi:MAG: hypothetical protein AMJ43_02730 [Coxiella sp. DG_40]|nr:MAG: hypothetical protein AMJ43_02730 [Coxiella sp. DG_40]